MKPQLLTDRNDPYEGFKGNWTDWNLDPWLQQFDSFGIAVVPQKSEFDDLQKQLWEQQTLLVALKRRLEDNQQTTIKRPAQEDEQTSDW